MFRIRAGKPTDIPAEIAGVRARLSLRARRLALHIDYKAGDVVLTWPRGVSERMALRFVEDNKGWIETHRKKIKPPQRFAAGEKIFIYGDEFTIINATGRGLTRLEGKNLVVHGNPEHLSRRIRDFLKETARQVLEDKASQKLEQIGHKKITAIRVIDPKTRWGSCSRDGGMMFSWRLILTPPEVLDYVVAHEVAHCIHMNHGKKFWALCSSLTENAAASRRWLRANGQTVMSYQ